MMLVVFCFFLQKDDGSGSKECVRVYMCLCVWMDITTKLIILNKNVQFLAFKALWSLKSQTDDFLFCFGCCFVFHVFIYFFNRMSQFKMADLQAT